MKCLNRSLVLFEFLKRKKLWVTGFLFMIYSVNTILGSNISASADTIKTKKPEAVDLTSFSDGINHALMGYKDKKAPYERYSPEEIDKISENFLVWQNKDGGWPKNIDWLKKYSIKEIEEILQREKDGSKSNSTFDNRNCQQHSYEDFKPVWARAFEPPSIASSESVSVVRLLMEIEKPSKEVIRSVESAVQWLDKVKISGIRIENVAAEPINFKYHYSDFDREIVKDENAPPIWSRYYDLEIEDPVFCTRQKVVTRNYTDLCRERRTGYAWFTYSPSVLIKTDFVKWSEKVSKLQKQ